MSEQTSLVNSLDDHQAEYLLAHCLLVQESPETYSRLTDLWESFFKIQELGREQFAAFDWAKADGETLFYALNKGSAFLTKLDKLFPQSFSNRFFHRGLQRLSYGI